MLTINCVLLDDKVRGHRMYSTKTGRIMMFLVQRDSLDTIQKITGLEQYGCYILFSGRYMENRRKFYIGQSQNVAQRIRQHDNGKEFWSQAAAFVSKSITFDRSEIQYLEYLCIKSAIETGTGLLAENCQVPTQPELSEKRKRYINECFDEMKMLLEFAGFEIYSTDMKIQIGDVTKHNQHNLMSRIAAEYHKKDRSSDNYRRDGNDDAVCSLYDNEESEYCVYWFKDEDCDARVIRTKNNGYMIIPFGFVKLCVNIDSLPEDIKNRIDKNTRKILRDIETETLEEAAQIITGDKQFSYRVLREE